MLGHSSCGAVSGAVKALSGTSRSGIRKTIAPAVKKARKIVEKNGGNPNDETQVIPVATDQNVIMVTQALQKQFRSEIGQGNLLVAGGRYDLSSQAVTLLIQ